MNKKYIYVDCMSYNNLEKYDDSLISNINMGKTLFMNTKYCGKYKNEKFCECIYDYSGKNFLRKNLSYLKAQLKLLKYIVTKKNKYHCIHFQWFKNPYIDYVVLFIIKKTTNLLIIHTAHNFLPHDTGKKFFNIYKKIYNIVDEIIVHTEDTKIMLNEKMKIDEQKLNIIPHGLLDLNNNIFKKKKQINNNENRINLLFIGNIRRNKGIDILSNCWNENLDDKYNLTIAGKYDNKIQELDRLKKYKNVKMDFKFLSDDEFNSYVDESDLVILPYKEISQSGVLMSLAKKHKPIVVSNIGGLTDFFKFGKVGYVIDELNEKNIYKCLINIEKNEIYNIHDNSSLWQQIEKAYSWTNIGKKTMEIYNKK